MLGCPSEDRLRAWLEGRLPADAQADLRAHIVVCAECIELAAAIATMLESPSGHELLAADRVLQRHGTPVLGPTVGLDAHAVLCCLGPLARMFRGVLSVERTPVPRRAWLDAGSGSHVEPDLDLRARLLEQAHRTGAPDAYHALATYYLAAGRGPVDLQRARFALERARDGGLDAATYANERGIIALNSGRPDEAATWFARALKASPPAVVAHVNRAMALDEAGLVFSVVRAWRAAARQAELAHLQPLVASGLQRALRRQRRLQDALREVLDPRDDAEAHVHPLARLHARLEEGTEALSDEVRSFLNVLLAPHPHRTETVYAQEKAALVLALS